jgi:glycine cleavage system H protein
LAERRYSETHEWVVVEDGVATIGITDFAQAQLGDVVFLELPRTGLHLEAGQSFGAIESVKAASDLYAPVAGTVSEVNDALGTTPELVNQDPFGAGWLIRLEGVATMPEALMDEAAYKQHTEGSA